MKTDPWHYPRTKLAEQVLGMFEAGLSSALVFFAPRRMGKTEFLRKDMMPLAEKQGWKVFYFSFLDVGSLAASEFTRALIKFYEENSLTGKASSLFKKVSKISGDFGVVKTGITLHDPLQTQNNIREVMDSLGRRGNVLLLLDEVQTLAQISGNANFVASLRTAMDIHKDSIKVIFTGSSQEGLRQMFSQSKAPFFHFGQNLPFPKLEVGFTNHLANMFEKITKRSLDRVQLWETFKEMQGIPQLIRSLVERLALNPELTLEQAKKQLVSEIFEDRAFSEVWQRCSPLEQLLLRAISLGKIRLFGAAVRNKLANLLGVQTISISFIQSTIRTLQRKELIGRFPESKGYFIDDLNFKHWLRVSPFSKELFPPDED